jgi:hypothetical protein
MALIEITLTIDGQAGPFDLFSNVDSFGSPFATQVPAASLTAGYSVVAPPGTSTVKVCSTGVCTNCIDILTNCPTTTTTTSSSTSTTTSTSTSTSTTTTEVPPNKLNWELITNTPGSLLAADPQLSNLGIKVNGIPVVDVEITGNASSQSGVIDIYPGDTVNAFLRTDRTGVYNFVNSIIKDGIFYQAQDTCDECSNFYQTDLSPQYVGAGVDVDFSFVGDTIKEEVTTTTTTTIAATTTTTTSSSSSTTTTTTTCDCSLNGATAIVTAGTTTTQVPATTTTTTTQAGGTRLLAVRSTLFDVALSIGICDYALNQFTFKSGQPVPQIGDILYDQSTGGSTFNGGNNYWHYQTSGASTTYTIRVGATGIISYVDTCFA